MEIDTKEPKMKLYLARHGETATLNMQPIDELSDEGSEKIKRLAQFLKPKKIHIQEIMHSEKKRAQQTAELLADGFVFTNSPRVQTGLKPNDDVAAFANEILNLSQDTLIVGHLPFMSRITSLLLTGNEDKEMSIFSPGTLVCLEEISNQRWAIEWMINPDLLG